MVFRFQLSLRGIEELLFERGVIVTYRDGRRRFVRYAPKEVPQGRHAISAIRREEAFRMNETARG
jgi:transposase-like protein